MAIGTGTALLGAAVIGGATSYLGGQSAKKAAKTNATQQVAAAQDAYNRIDRATQDFSEANPYIGMGRQFGSAITGRLAGLMGYTDFPGSTPPPAGANPAGVMPAGMPAGAPAPVYNPNAASGGMSRSIFGEPERVTMGSAGPGGGRDMTGISSGAMPASSAMPAAMPGVMPGVMPSTDGRTEFLRNTPGYQYAFDESMRALDHSMSSRNALYSGKAMKEIVRHAQGMAEQNYDRAIARELTVGDRVADNQRTVLAAATGNAQLMQAAQSDAANLRQQGSNQQLAGTMGGVKALTDGALSVWGPQE